MRLFESTQAEVLGGPDLLDVGEFLQRGEETAEILGDETETKLRMYRPWPRSMRRGGSEPGHRTHRPGSRDLAQDPLES